jgi:biopolymer transport protein ExbD
MKSSRTEIMGEINITPLTDIFLVLLIIMMVVAPLLEYRQLDLAVASNAEAQDEETNPDEESKTVHLVIAADGSYAIDGDPVAAAALADEIRRRAVDKPEGLIIETHGEAEFQHMARAMDAAQIAGIVHVTTAETVVKEPEPAKEDPPAKKPASKSSSKSSKKK